MMSRSDDPQLDVLLEFIREQRGIDFSAYKEASLRRRLQKRMNGLGIADYAAYLDYLQASPDEFEPLLDTLFINVTQFFRDPEAWDALSSLAIKPLAGARAEHEPIRVWCPGVATGEEAITAAMLLAEELGSDRFRERVKIYATDLDDEDLDFARAATYSEKQLQSVPERLREKYFEPVSHGFALRSDLRRSLIIGRHNLLEDAPISRLDLLICRNTLIYFNREAQSRVIARFHFALRDDAFLFLGQSEMLLTRRNLFAALDTRSRIFTKVPQVTLRDRLAVLAQSGTEHAGEHVAVGQINRLRDLAFEHATLPQIVVDANGILMLANEMARTRFSIVQSEIGRPFRDHELSFRPLELRSRIEQALTARESVVINAVERTMSDGSVNWFDIRVTPIHDLDGRALATTISFLDVTSDRDLRIQLEQSRNELETAYEELQSTNEELETTNEELQSTIEELETTNEELQSTNEELETMNEELQSSNEEIRAVNDELRERSAIVARLNAYMRSILGSVKPGVIVLDERLHVHIWNRQATEQWGLREDEIEGQAFLNLDIGLPIHEIRDLMRTCLRGESEGDVVFLKAHNRRGKEIDVRLTCGPLLGPDGRVSGLILLTEDWRADEAVGSA